MDHFMGFDQLLRLFLARETTLQLFGPPGISTRAGNRRLHLEPDRRVRLSIDVTEIADDTSRLAVRRARALRAPRSAHEARTGQA
jgi:hypothetical protein